ncbi:hypothetical protein J6590_027755 [Homalodisca vitripennis]|nr:hypothetical protein J6590_027755 [Homalodisca vitripennis]
MFTGEQTAARGREQCSNKRSARQQERQQQRRGTARQTRDLNAFMTVANVCRSANSTHCMVISNTLFTDSC